MRRLITCSALIIAIAFFAMAFSRHTKRESLDMNSSVYELLVSLGYQKAKHAQETPDPKLVQQGKEIVLTGRTERDGEGKSKYVSKFYTCTNCHNVAQEDPDLRFSNPDTRLDYVQKNGIPFLQGTTFYGAVNRETWYNDDYVKKYGDLVKPARNDLTEAVQLCAKVCSQGRYLEDWELQSVMAYLWSLEYKLSDLKLSDELVKEVEQAKASGQANPELVKKLKALYAQKSPATFVDPPSDKNAGYEGITGNADNGAKIYGSGCQSCHKPYGASRLVLDNSKMTFKKFKRNLNKPTNFSIYEITRHGTHVMEGHRPYMPHYTLERMSHQQVEDLRAFFEREAE